MAIEELVNFFSKNFSSHIFLIGRTIESITVIVYRSHLKFCNHFIKISNVRKINVKNSCFMTPLLI